MSDKQYPFPATEWTIIDQQANRETRRFEITADATDMPESLKDAIDFDLVPVTVVSREEWDALCARIAELEAAADELARLMKKSAEVPVS